MCIRDQHSGVRASIPTQWHGTQGVGCCLRERAPCADDRGCAARSVDGEVPHLAFSLFQELTNSGDTHSFALIAATSRTTSSMYALATINPGMSAWGPMVSNADAQVRKYSAQSPAARGSRDAACASRLGAAADSAPRAVTTLPQARDHSPSDSSPARLAAAFSAASRASIASTCLLYTSD